MSNQSVPASRPPGAVPAELVGRQFHAMVKPAGSQCNLDCTYCFYLHKSDLLRQPKNPRMADDVLENHIRQYIAAQPGNVVLFSWQGGEPTLAGLDFFRRVVELQARYKKPWQRIENDLQTNGILLDDDWGKFLRQNHFLVGLSLDGPRRLHDRYRVTKGGKSTHEQVMAAARRLKQHGVPFNVLCVVNRENARYPLDVYRFLSRETAAQKIQFIPGIEPRDFRNVAPQHWPAETMPSVGTPAARPGNPDSVVTDWSVDPEDWGRFLCRIWDDWFQRDYGKVFVDLFEGAIAQHLGLPAQRCVNAETCGQALAIEHDGTVYSCDHYVYPEYQLGNLATDTWAELANGPRQTAFGNAKRDTLPDYCRQCAFLNFCWGECPRSRFVRTPDGAPGLHYLCPGLKHFYAHIQKDLPEIARRIRAADEI
jgi:uncharacterized protein